MNSLDPIGKAVALANEAHKGQRRKDQSRLPYIVHPMAVASLVRSYVRPHNETMIIAALLHDVVEDTNTSLSQIEELFGKEVASLVQELTNDPKEIAKIGKTSYLQSKMIHMSNNALTIKLCDRLDNLQDSEGLSPDQAKQMQSNTKEIIEVVEDIRGGDLLPVHQTLIRRLQTYWEN